MFLWMLVVVNLSTSPLLPIWQQEATVDVIKIYNPAEKRLCFSEARRLKAQGFLGATCVRNK